MEASEITRQVLLTLLAVAGLDLGIAFLMRGVKESSPDGD